MPVWTCPNTKCTYEKDMKPGEKCPLCGQEAQPFDFDEFGRLLKEKWAYKKKIQKDKQGDVVARMIKFCPRCGSPNINALVFYRPSIWKCLDCGYEGTFIVQDGTLAEQIRKDYEKTRQEEKQS